MKHAWSTMSIGRFSTGMEQTGPNADKDRIGRFSTGMEQTGPNADKDRIGRFSTGMEQTGLRRAELEERTSPRDGVVS
jgi:hypothetical protein